MQRSIPRVRYGICASQPLAARDATAAPTATITQEADPMPYTLTRMKVEDYPHWRRAFEENADAREEAGSQGGHLFRSDGDHQEVVVFLAWDDLGDARDYLDSEAVREEREAGGVEEEPEVLFLEELGRPNR